jgi:DNA processing protein
MDDEERAWLALALVASGRPDGWLAIALATGSARTVLAASDAELVRLGAGQTAIGALRRLPESEPAKVELDCRRLGIGIAALPSPAYPPRLREIPDPPLVLFWKGVEPSGLDPAVAVVGARACSSYGERIARAAGRDIARGGIVVVSGLARGIDVAAHRGALETGRTAAVLAGGLDRIYPAEHRAVAERIVAEHGCLVSEQPPGAPSLPRLFPFRNRIITGLSLATLVVEARTRSGSLASVRHALEQGREVFAVPGPADSPLSEGSNRLLGQGAMPYLGAADLAGVPGLEGLARASASNLRKLQGFMVSGLPPDQAVIVRAVTDRSAAADEIAATTGLDGTRVLALLTALELDGLIRREEHGRFRAAVRGT